MKHTLPGLPYEYKALEPYIDERTMTIHHTKHHQAYVDNLNAALDKHPELFDVPLTDLLKKLDTLPADIQTAVRNNGGGHYNHSLFWTVMAPSGGKEPSGPLLKALNSAFGSFEAFKDAFNTVAKTRFGSGWAWLILTKEKALKVLSTPNQDAPLLEGEPLLALDVWEHAYYLSYQNRRPEYVSSFWYIVNWDKVSELYQKASAK